MLVSCADARLGLGGSVASLFAVTGEGTDDGCGDGGGRGGGGSWCRGFLVTFVFSETQERADDEEGGGDAGVLKKGR